MKIRTARPTDRETIDILLATAFGRPEEARIVRSVLAEEAVLVELVAEDAGELVGHVMFSRMRCDPPRVFAGLGPLAVKPERQGQGLGAALARGGIERCWRDGAEAIVVLGQPTYYARFGFSAAAAAMICSPYAGLPAFMALALRPGALAARLRLAYPAAFD